MSWVSWVLLQRIAVNSKLNLPYLKKELEMVSFDSEMRVSPNKNVVHVMALCELTLENCYSDSSIHR
jgi:hypothetical protein